MKTILPFVFYFLFFNSYSQSTTNTIRGIITHGEYPLVNANIAIKGTSMGTESGIDGNYEIKASPRDVLVFSYVGMQAVDIVVEDVARILNINMARKVEELEGVTITKRVRKTQKDFAIEYNTDKNIIRTGYGYIHKDFSAFNIKTLAGSELNPAAVTILDAIIGKFPGIEIDRGFGGGKPMVFIRRKGRVIFELDGMVFTDVPMWVDVNSIERIGLITGTVAARKWGNGGAGILIINTNQVQNALLEEGIGKPYDRVKLRNNIFSNDAITQEMAYKNESSYLSELYGCKTKEEGLAVYDKYKGNYGSLYSFAVDAYCFFKKRFDDKNLANRIIRAHEHSFKENPVALKALAYVYQSKGDFKKANELYKEIFIQRPNYAQSYMDLANSYRELGDAKKATSLYMRYDYLVNEGFLENDSTAFAKIMDRELNNLIAVGGRDILSKRDFKKAVLEEDFNGTRLVFEWNDSEAEFELQFVNPEGRYFKTVHSLASDAERIREEKLLGYSCEEFLIDESLPGTWQVNAKYLGNKSLTPSYVKATIYYDYGSAAQHKEIKVFKLGLKNVNQELFKVSNVGKVASN